MVSLRGSLLLGLLVTCNVLLVQCALNLNMNVEDMEKRYYNGRALDIPLGEEGTHELHGHWIGQALSGLMAAVATERAENIAKHHRDELFACSKKASDIHQHAKCVVKSLDAPDHKEEKVIQVEEAKAEDNDVQWVGGMAVARAKRSAGPRVVSKSSYTLNDDNDANPFAMLAKHLTSTVRAMKHKKGAESWHETLLKVKKLEHQQKEEDAKRDALKKRLRSMIEAMPENVDTTHKQQALKQLEEVEHPKNMTDVEAKKEAIRIPMQLMREAVKIGMQLTGKNVSHFDDKTIKMVSPRFFSVVPDQDNDETVNLISPSLFSLHEDGDELERVLSLPGLFKRMNLKGQDAWMDFIIEASGVGDIVEDKLKKDEPNAKRDKELRGSRGEPLYFTKKNVTEMYGEAETQKVETFEKLDKSYSKDQIAEMDKRGYTFLSNDQLDLVYGDDSPYKSNHFREGFKNISKEQQLDFIINNIRGIAAAKPNRTKRAIEFSPFILQNLVFVGQTLSQPVTLSPLVLSPITLSPAVLGPITLSPWVFIPLILSPRVLSPLIVSPLVGSPIILSPLVLHPLILVPGVLNPFILSPFVLSPFILSPQALTPLILSPFALSPLILTPMVLSPLILSPFVLSPIILSPQTLFAVVLSPYALSPLIESKLTASEVVLSPSWLS